MYHSITFQKCSNGSVVSSKNTWDDWHLVPSSRPVFSPPAQKTRFLDIPGADGFLDMSDALTGYPIYNNRQGSFDFIVVNESDDLSAPGTNYGLWHQRYTEIMEFLHGKELRAILEDDNGYFYEGRFAVNQWVSEKERSKITIDYNVKPYKFSVQTSLERAPLRFNNISINSPNSWTSVAINQSDIGFAPTCPNIKINSVSGIENVKNLIFDGSFFDGGAWHVDYWNLIGRPSSFGNRHFNGQIFVSADETSDGSLLLDISNNSNTSSTGYKPTGDYYVKYKKNIPVKPNTKYAFGFSVIFTGETQTYLAPVNMFVTMYDKNGNAIENGTLGLPGGSKQPPLARETYRYNTSFTTTSDTSYVKVHLSIYHTTGQRNHFAFDSVMLFETDEEYYTYDPSTDTYTARQDFPFDDAAIGLLFKYDNETDEERRNLTIGNHKIHDVVLNGSSSHTLYFKGTGNVSIEFREGRL